MRLTDAGILFVALLLVWSLYRAHRDVASSFNVLDLFMDRGRVSKMAFAFMTTLGVTSWIMVRLTTEGKLTEGYFAGYGVMWVAPLVAKLFSVQSPSSMTTTTSMTQETK